MDLDLKLMGLSLHSGLASLISLAFNQLLMAQVFLAVMVVLMMMGMAVGILKKP